MTLRLLLSWHYFKDADLDKVLDESFAGLDVELDIFADSGAFSAYTLGEPLDPAIYTSWVQRWSHRFTCAAGPDVIGDPGETERATAKMASEVTALPILPTFHMGESWDYLERACAAYGYIALGGMVPYSRRKKLLASWLDKAFSIIPSGVKVHGFGMTTWDFLLRYPWYSVDSSSWTAVFRYGTLSLFDDAAGKFVQVEMHQPSAILKHSSLIESYGLRLGETLGSDTKVNRESLCRAAIESWHRAERYLTGRRISLSTDRPERVSRALTSVYMVAGAPSGPSDNASTRAIGAAFAERERVYLVATKTNPGSFDGLENIGRSQRESRIYLGTNYLTPKAPNSLESIAASVNPKAR